jgi:hypothetical protein
VRRIILFVAALAILPAGLAVAQSGLKVTGGGQVVAGNGDGGGPGDTIAFNAQETQETEQGNARGQLQVIDRNGGDNRGRDQERFHGVVTCIQDETPDPDHVRFGGRERQGGNGQDQSFTVEVRDNGEGGNDMIWFYKTDEPCGDPDGSSVGGNLSRGNLKVHRSNGE